MKQLIRHWISHKDLRILTGAGRGLRFNVANADPRYILGTNERPVQTMLSKRLSKGDVFYDIGANVGFLTILGAKFVGANGKVYAFEPVKENAEAIRKNARLNHFAQIKVTETAISNANGQATFLLTNHPGGGVLDTASVTAPPDVRAQITVPLASIDQLLANQKIKPPTLIKIDVEGAEIKVLQGMVETIKSCKPVILYEIDDKTETGLAEKQAVCDTFLQAFGYKLSKLEDSYPNLDWKVAHTIAIPCTK